jgi:hypothetical protein
VPAPPSTTPDWTIGVPLDTMVAGSSSYQYTFVRSTEPLGEPPECVIQRWPLRFMVKVPVRWSLVSIVVAVPACAASIWEKSKLLATKKSPESANVDPATTLQLGEAAVPVIWDMRSRRIPPELVKGLSMM